MSTDPAFLWFGEKHKEALATLKYAILENKGVLALTGDVGTGKTTLINALVQSLGEDTLSVTIYDPNLEVLDFFNVIATAFNMGKTFESKGDFIVHFRKFLENVRARKQKVLLIIDEAQSINAKLLEEIRLLSNLEAEYTRLLNIFFVGQNEFIDILQEHRNRAFRQRITITYHIKPLMLSETEAYIQHRLDISGAKTRIFSSGAIEEIFAFSGGYPRLINIICDHALLSGFVQDLKTIDVNIIRECREELLVSKKVSEKDSASPKNAPPAAFKLVSPIREPEDDQRHDKRHIMPLALGIALLAVIGTVSGYVYYNGGKIKSTAPVSDVLKQKNVSHSMKKEPTKNKTAVVSQGAEAQKKPDKILSEEAENTRFFIIRSPEPKLFKETVPKKTGSFDAVSSGLPAGGDGIQTSTDKTGGSESPGSQKAVEADKTGGPVILPTGPQRAEAAIEKAPTEVKKSAAVPPDLNKEKRATPSAADHMSRTIPTSISNPLDVHKKPKTSKTARKDSAERTQKSSASKTQVIPVKTENITPANNMTHAERVKIKKEFSSVSSGLTEKPAGTIAAASSVKHPVRTAVPEKDKIADDQMVTQEKPWVAVMVPDKKKAAIQSDEDVYLLNWPVSKRETGGEHTLPNRSLQDRLETFLSDYCRAYEQKNLEKFSTFFAPDAVEKGKPFTSLRSQYRQNFNKLDSVNYTIKLDRYATQPATGMIRIEGTFQVRGRLSGGEDWQEKDGPILMVLETDNDSFKIKRLEY